MSIRNLAFAVHPRSICLVGASPTPGSVGRVILDNLLAGGFDGPIWPVNPKYAEIAGLPAFHRVADLPAVPDLAVIATPASTVPGIISELADKGCRAAIIITAGFSEANGLKPALYAAAAPKLLRIIGPNTLGLMIPPLGLNASFSHLPARPGSIALLSQSGAIVTTIIDWAAEKALGFSQIVSLGDMADVDVGDYLDILAGDPATKAVILYLESIPEPRKFMSAARACARIKPVIAIKAGRHAAAAKAARTHTGALSGADRVTDAALRRAGILRVRDLAGLFGATEAIGRFGPLPNARAAIVTNGGGAGVMAVDEMADRGGALAELSEATIATLDATLPTNWSRANPVDIIGDAPPERYRAAVEAVAADPGVDVVIVMNCPTALASPIEAARMLAGLAPDGRVNGKPVLACWLGEMVASKGRAILEAAGIASFETPADVAAAVSFLADWTRAQRQLTRVAHDPAAPAMANGEGPGEDDLSRAAVTGILATAAAEGRTMLSEAEAKAVLAAYGIPVPRTLVARDIGAVPALAAELLASHPAIAVKLVSKTVTHKSDVGGVVLNVASPEAAEAAARAIAERLDAAHPGLKPDGYSLQPMVRLAQAEELILGVSRDPVFGPVLLFGAGGVAVEVLDDSAVGLPPLDAVLAGDMIDATRIGALLKGYRDRRPADRDGVIAALEAMSRLVVDIPAIVAMDINPLLVNADAVIALDARIEIDPARIGEAGPNRDLAIRPWPTGWQTRVTTEAETPEGTRDDAWLLRPILPADVDLYPDFLARVSAEDLTLRFLTARPRLDDQMLKRLTQLDYDRDMAFVAIHGATGALGGIARMSSDPDHESADFAILVRSDLKGRGLGRALMAEVMRWARAEGIDRLEGRISPDNARMIDLCTRLGFVLSGNRGGEETLTARLDL